MPIKLNGETGGSVSFDAPDNTSPGGTNVTLTLPTSAGSANQFLKNSGTAGTLAYSSLIEDGSGRVGIGTSSPGAELEIKKTSTPVIRLNQNDTFYAPIKLAGNDLEIRGSSGQIEFYTGAADGESSTERMRITDSGTIRAISTGTGATFSTTLATSDSSNSAIEVKGGGTAGVADSGTRTFQVNPSGNVKNANNSYGSLSDIKLKENIVDANSQWNDLKALQVRNYNFKEGQTHTQIGLVAQEVELISPGLVTESPDTDEDGNDLGTVTKSVIYSVLYMKAVKALQEAMERIETLEAKVAALEGGAS